MNSESYAEFEGKVLEPSLVWEGDPFSRLVKERFRRFQD